MLVQTSRNLIQKDLTQKFINALKKSLQTIRFLKSTESSYFSTGWNRRLKRIKMARIKIMKFR